MGVCTSLNSLNKDAVTDPQYRIPRPPHVPSKFKPYLPKSSNLKSNERNNHISKRPHLLDQESGPNVQVSSPPKASGGKKCQNKVENSLNPPIYGEGSRSKQLDVSIMRNTIGVSNDRDSYIKPSISKLLDIHESNYKENSLKEVRESVEKRSEMLQPAARNHEESLFRTNQIHDTQGRSSDISKIQTIGPIENDRFKPIQQEVKQRSTTRAAIPGELKPPRSYIPDEEFSDKEEEWMSKEKQVVFKKPIIEAPYARNYLLINANGIKNLVPQLSNSITTSSLLQRRIMNKLIVPSDEFNRPLIPSSRGMKLRFL